MHGNAVAGAAARRSADSWRDAAGSFVTKSPGDFVTESRGLQRKLIMIPGGSESGSGEIPTRLRDKIEAAQTV